MRGLGFYVLFLVFVIGLLWYWAEPTIAPPSLEQAGLTRLSEKVKAEKSFSGELVPAWSPSLGSAKAPVTIVEFGDFQCPFCAAAFVPVRQILQEYPGKIHLVFRHFPIQSLHENALALSKASMCANEQGKFWSLHDRLFQFQDSVTASNIEDQVKSVGVELARYRQCLDADRYKDKIAQDFSDGLQLGARGTPTWIINGQKVEGVLSLEAWREIMKSLFK